MPRTALLLMTALLLPTALATAQELPDSPIVTKRVIEKRNFYPENLFENTSADRPRFKIRFPDPFIATKPKTTNYRNIVIQSGVFLGIQTSIRLTEEKTIRELKGPFLKDWFESVRSIRGWNDGNTSLTNWVGHPLMGSTAAFIFAQNHEPSKRAKPGWNKAYWNSKKKQLIFSFIYSENFEFGPVSESSIGNVGLRRKGEQSYMDHVVTPLAGTLLSIGEDLIDYKLIRPVMKTHKAWGAILAFFLNPTRSAANMLAFKWPWHRSYN
ncbi:MAG: hypothetical protein A2925_04695 [Candidatus Yanofskybacteria bacterium RIFCSPLOWO2_01_FULL_44_22]|uniref:DUF3943 domain-containing protein n=2 Tax=Candidatus Yanofskyibacteriota TaxID=1752733 RepID=A0A1F8GNI7_9BACT|nr:MAG: hypothetical protein A2659_00315 [Candidatus Yanofskybacteria bacterium RIFCSPHIGHO2_01_FULL_44_24]OGN25999.1 MAG: hypothetical protein A2925_04695 [Candidatus Yanofskybacteria bacterium RIFCSPLOWO2_01_FULL_44_22]